MAVSSSLLTGVILLVLQGLVVIVLGVDGQMFSNRYALQSATEIDLDVYENTFNMFFYFATAMFTVLGFGMLHAYFRRAPWSGPFIAIFIVSITVAFAPLIFKFWFSVFFGFDDN